jgi:hypothetical protein
MLGVANTASWDQGNRVMAVSSVLWLCSPIRLWAPNRFQRNILAVGRDRKPSPSKANVRTVVLGRALPPKARKHVDLAEPSGMGGLDENLSSQAHFLGAKACSQSGPSKAYRAIHQWARGCARGHLMSVAPEPLAD